MGIIINKVDIIVVARQRWDTRGISNITSHRIKGFSSRNDANMQLERNMMFHKLHVLHVDLVRNT